MPSAKDKAKDAILRQRGCRHPRPDAVRDEGFASHAFFDSRDLLQVKYEMLRRVRVDGWTVRASARAFGLSRPTFYAARKAYEQGGLPALLPAKPGPRRPHKLSGELLQALRAERAQRPAASAADLARLAVQRFGVQVHPRSIARALARKESDDSP